MVSFMPGPGWRRRRGRGRPFKPRFVGVIPQIKQFIPVIPPSVHSHTVLEPVFLTYDEYEALRLIDYEGLTQEEAGVRMGVSRGTIWRLVQSARRKVISALVEGREIRIIPTDAAELSGALENSVQSKE